jgi:hypothetical protein
VNAVDVYCLYTALGSNCKHKNESTQTVGLLKIPLTLIHICQKFPSLKCFLFRILTPNGLPVAPKHSLPHSQGILYAHCHLPNVSLLGFAFLKRKNFPDFNLFNHNHKIVSFTNYFKFLWRPSDLQNRHDATSCLFPLHLSITLFFGFFLTTDSTKFPRLSLYTSFFTIHTQFSQTVCSFSHSALALWTKLCITPLFAWNGWSWRPVLDIRQTRGSQNFSVHGALNFSAIFFSRRP